MPQYYIDNSNNPFLSGAMAGFELFENAAERRAAAEERKHQRALEAERMDMARKDQARQDELFELGKADRLETKGLELRKRKGGTLGDLAKYHGGLDKVDRNTRIAITRESDPTRFANATDDEVDAAAEELMIYGSDYAEDEAQRLRTKAEEEALHQKRRGEDFEDFKQQQGYAAGMRRNEAEWATNRMQAGVRGILDLANRPAEEPVLPITTPTGGHRGGRAAGTAGPMTVTQSAPAVAPTAAPGARQVRAALSWAEGFKDSPLDTVTRWQSERASIADPKLRESLDIQAANAIKSRAQMLSQEVDSARKQGLNKEAAARASEALKLRAQAQDLGRKIAADKIATTTGGRPVRRGEQAAAAVQQAVNAQSGVTPQAEAAEVRALLTQMTRLSERPPQRFNEDQLNRVSRAVALGVITLEQATNLTQYGRMDKPAPLEYKVVGDSLAVISDNGIQFVDPSGATAGKGGSIPSSDERLADKENAQFIADRLKALVEDNKFDKWGPGDPKVSEVYGGFWEALTRFGPQIEQTTSISVTAPGGGRVSTARIDPGTANILTLAYRDYRANETDAVFKAGRGFDYYVRQRLGVPEQAAQGTTGDDGWGELSVN